MQVTSSAVSYIGYTAREWDIHDTAYMAGYREARKDAAEDKQRAKIRKLKQDIKHQYKLCIIKQKVIGVMLIAAGGIMAYILDGDATASAFIIPIGAYMALTKELIIDDSSVEKLRKLKRELRKEREVAQW